MRGLTDREVEIEHLKTTVIALDEKVKVANDITKDLDAKTADFDHSEVKRAELQQHLTQTSAQIREDA